MKKAEKGKKGSTIKDKKKKFFFFQKLNKMMKAKKYQLNLNLRKPQLQPSQQAHHPPPQLIEKLRWARMERRRRQKGS